MDESVCCRDGTYFVLIICHVSAYTVGNILADFVIPCQIDFHTFVGHVATVDIRSVGTGCGDDRRLYNPVFCLLVIPVKVQAQSTVQESGIKAEVGLFRCLPLQIVVTQSVGISAVRVGGSALACTEVVCRTSQRDSGSIEVSTDIVVAHLSPAGTQDRKSTRLNSSHQIISY